jgi:ubiquinone/menaquinone biosynthesis C-methylase UbiE
VVPADTAPESSLAAFAPVHDRALEEIDGRTVLDLGTCFGFLPLRLADEGFDVLASDHTVGTMTLLAAIARHTSRRVRTVVCDARAVPAASGSVDTVTAVHLLEHLPAADTAAVFDEMCRVARRRVVVAVPFEDVPDPVYGHLRRFDLADLEELGERSGLAYRVDEHHGGWLVADAT